MIEIIGLMPEFDLLPLRAVRAVREADVVVLQSGRAECAKEIGKESQKMLTLDDLYEKADDFDALYAEGARFLEEQGKEGRVVFGVIGSVAGNGFAEALRKKGIPFSCLAESYAVEAALGAAAQRMDTGEYTVLRAREIGDAYFDTGKAVVITEIDNALTASAVKCRLSDYYGENEQGLLYADGLMQWMNVYDLDRIEGFRTGGVMVLPPQPLTGKERYGLYDLVRIMKILRGENGCPWDAEQTHQSLRQYILEEAYEAVDAIDADDMHALYDELGDVFLQVVFHAEVARQCGEFDIDDVASAVCAKMIGRHPHIFGDGSAATANDVFVNWEAIKRKEKDNRDFASVLHDVPQSMGAMMRAYKLQKKAAAIGFDWSSAKEAFAKVTEELGEWQAEIEAENADFAEAEAGDLLFAVINVLRLSKTNPEVALNRTCRKFIARMEQMEKDAGCDLAKLDSAELEILWTKAKKIFP